METFAEPKELVENHSYEEQKRKSLSELRDVIIDESIIEIVNGFNKLPFCFTMQSCYGHFLYTTQKDPNNLDTLPVTGTIGKIEYRIAYIAFCIENCDSGRMLLNALNEITFIDPENIQLCSAEWFWKRQVNSYALQVEPDRCKYEDRALLDYEEALNIEKIRNEFFVKLKELLRRLLTSGS